MPNIRVWPTDGTDPHEVGKFHTRPGVTYHVEAAGRLVFKCENQAAFERLEANLEADSQVSAYVTD